MRETRYDPRKGAKLEINGVEITKFASDITVIHKGDEVCRTEGTDGTGLNRSTPQGADITFALNGPSESTKLLQALRHNQEQTPTTFRIRLSQQSKDTIELEGSIQIPTVSNQRYGYFLVGIPIRE